MAPIRAYDAWPGQSLGLQLDNVWLNDIPAIANGDKGFDFAVWVQYEDTLPNPLSSDRPNYRRGSAPIVMVATALATYPRTIAPTTIASRAHERSGNIRCQI